MAGPQVVVVDEFLDDPDAVRAVALRQPFVKLHSAGLRTQRQFLDLAPYQERFEALLGRPTTGWWDNPANGRFQLCVETDRIPYHSDSQAAAGVLFLTPGAPVEAGLSFLQSRAGGLRRRSDDPVRMELTFGGGAEFDRDRWLEVDRIGNVYNRLVLFDGRLAHGASAYFGRTLTDGRLFQNFFFDLA